MKRRVKVNTECNELEKKPKQETEKQRNCQNELNSNDEMCAHIVHPDVFYGKKKLITHRDRTKIEIVKINRIHNWLSNLDYISG